MSKPFQITGKSSLVGLIGWPVEHSLSPVMHNAAFAELGLDWAYVPLAVTPTSVELCWRKRDRTAQTGGHPLSR